MGYAILFSGQGMQHAGMLSWLVEDYLVQQTCNELGVNDWRTALSDTSWACANINAQILLTGINLAAWGQLSGALPQPSAVAGYSVGELASFATADVFDASTAIQLSRSRAQAMDRCALSVPSGLLAISGLPKMQVDYVCEEYGLAVAIENDSHAVVVGGPVAALRLAAVDAEGRGAHCTHLKVSLASHTHWMKDAAQEFALKLGQIALRAPRIPLFCNAVDRASTAIQAQQALSQQISKTVHWNTCMENIWARRVSCVLEVGPGAALARMWNQRFPDIPARSADEFANATSIAEWILRHSDY